MARHLNLMYCDEVGNLSIIPMSKLLYIYVYMYMFIDIGKGTTINKLLCVHVILYRGNLEDELLNEH